MDQILFVLGWPWSFALLGRQEAPPNAILFLYIIPNLIFICFLIKAIRAKTQKALKIILTILIFYLLGIIFLNWHWL